MQGVAAGAKACAAVLFCKNFREMRIPARFSLDRGNELLYNMSCSDEVAERGCMRLWRNWQTRYFEGVVFTRRMGSSPINRTILQLGSMSSHRTFFYSFFAKGEIFMLYPLKLSAPLKDYLWGGTRLKAEYNKSTELDKIAESWELSCHKDGESVIANGPDAGKTLSAYIEEQGRSVLGKNAEKFSYFPILIKLIDAKGNLSVQVHPDNDYALRVEGEYGKTEMWYVVDCEPGASLLYGFQQEISKEEFARRIEEGTLLEVCNRVPVKKGDVFFIEAGTLHAIGEGILICEIQQNSNTTYRVYDYGRVGADGKPRALHVEQAKDVTRLAPPQKKPGALAEIHVFPDAEVQLLASCEYFTVYRFVLDGQTGLQASDASFQAITVLDGTMRITSETGMIELSKGETGFLPAGLGYYEACGRAEFILSEV